MNRRMLTLVAALVPVAALLGLGTVVQVPFVALGPGPTFNTLGEVEGKPVIDIEGTELDPTSGNLNMTTVSVRDGLTIFDAFGFWLSGRHGLVPREEVYPADRSRDEVQQENAADFAQSEESAELAALHFLDLPVALEISDVADDGPSHDLLRVGDRIVSVDGVPVQTVGDVQRAVADLAPGTVAPIVVDRDGGPVTVPVTLGARPGHTEVGYLGVTPTEIPEVPFTVDFNLAEVGGPSAGLMFTLAVIDKLSPGELNGGGFVAGTGTIDSDGDVGPIGGIQYKLIAAREAGATTFLVPSKNCDEAAQRTPDGLRLVRVDDLTGAVDALDSLNAGGDAPSC
ncbi:PDZ domain-containing protein [Rhodococcus sp. NPDC058505]|uniref:YlbL family protein n=1 Tax=unclassified Rhodococcus (in: high G+C Gram-positive bacteria) TaxID=192944 RepID=UPI0036652934